MRVVAGRYELALGVGAGERGPEVAARLIVGSGFEYEMIIPDAWHWARAIDAPAMTIMLTGPRFGPAPRERWAEDAPIPPLSEAEVEAMLDFYRRRYPG